MAFTQDDIDALDEAYKGGEERVKTSDGKEVEFRSVAEYLQLRRLMEGQVAGDGSRRAGRASYMKLRRDGGG